MREAPIPVVSLSEVGDPDAFRARVMHIALGSLPEDGQDEQA